MFYKSGIFLVCWTYNPRTWEMKAGGSGVQGQLWLPSEFEASLHYMRPSFKNNEKQVRHMLDGFLEFLSSERQ